MKLKSAVTRLSGAQINAQNAISFLEVQDGVLHAAGKVVNRMIELKGLADDVMKNSSDKANYNLPDLQVQLYDMNSVKFNGVTMFAQFTRTQTGRRASSTTWPWTTRSACPTTGRAGKVNRQGHAFPLKHKRVHPDARPHNSN